MPKVFSTKEFDTWERILSREHKEEIDDIIKQLKKSKDVGRPLGYPFFREKKFDKYRIYYLIYEDLDVILLITINDKKTQQETINRIKESLDQYNKLIRNKIKEI